MKIALCATHLFNMTLPQDRDYIGVDHGVEELLKQDAPPFSPVYRICTRRAREILLYKIENH